MWYNGAAKGGECRLERIKVAVGEDHAVLRRALVTALRQDPDIDVLGDAENGLELVELCRAAGPDVAVVDIRMPVMDGVQAASVIKAELPAVKVLILTTFDDEEYLRKLFALGIDGYLLKNEDHAALANAVKSVYIGYNTLDRSITAKLAAMMGGPTPPAELSPMEEKVARMAAQGLYNKDIARELDISYGRARNLVSQVYRKLGALERAEMGGFLSAEAKEP